MTVLARQISRPSTGNLASFTTTAPGTVVANQLYAFTSAANDVVPVVFRNAATSGESVECEIEGIMDFDKPSTCAYTRGEIVQFDYARGNLTRAESTNVAAVGFAVEPCACSASTVRVMFNKGPKAFYKY